jgi:DNA-binding transcriptional MerR regulator
MICRGKMNINEIAEKLNISIDTIRKWEKHFNLEVSRDSEGRRFYSDSDLKMFHAIKLLRDNENTPVEIAEPFEQDIDIIHDIHSLNFLIKEIRVLLENRLTYILEISEKYSKVSYELGNLKAKLETKEQVLSLISETYNKVINSLKKEIEKKNKELDEINLKKDLEIEYLRAELEKERNKPWWKKIIT